MSRPAQPDLSTEIAAALDWWRLAGVDAVFADEAQAWLKAVEAPSPAEDVPAKRVSEPAPAQTPQVMIGGDRAGWPGDLAGFAEWWLAEPSLDEGGLAPRIAPHGPQGAELMVIVDQPELQDAETLLSGSDGALLSSMLAAADISHDRVYRASALTRHTMLPDWERLSVGGIGAILAHHIALVRPERLIVFGSRIPSLLGHNSAQGSQPLRIFNHEGGRVPVLSMPGLDRLRANARMRARAWQQWLDWMDG